MADTKQAAKDVNIIAGLIIMTPRERKTRKPSPYYAMDHQTTS
jgi:hypothetical protein